MQFLVGVLIFCLVLFLYLHVHYHMKTSNDLEVFELEQPSKDKLEDVCDLRQPVKFNISMTNLDKVCKQSTIQDSYGAFDVKVRDLQLSSNAEEELYVLMPLSTSIPVIQKDTNSRYVLESNMDFLEETGISKDFRITDEFIRPHLVSSCIYDICIGSLGACTPFRYGLNYRNYIYATEGKVTIKLAPPKSAKHLHEIRDYENFEFRSPINPWNTQSNFQGDFDKVKCLEISLKKGEILYIPAYWWYSIKFETESTLCTFNYMTYMNTVAILPKLFMRFLQEHNIKRQTETIITDNTLKTE